jgi:hypothetical protein
VSLILKKNSNKFVYFILTADFYKFLNKLFDSVVYFGNDANTIEYCKISDKELDELIILIKRYKERKKYTYPKTKKNE